VALTGDSAARSDGLAFAVGAGFIVFAALTDRRGMRLRRRAAEPEPLPLNAVREPSWRVAIDAAMPSTVGVTVLGAIALAAGKDVLGALLGGTVAGLGIASAVAFVVLLMWESERSTRLYVGSDGRRYVSPPK